MYSPLIFFFIDIPFILFVPIYFMTNEEVLLKGKIYRHEK